MKKPVSVGGLAAAYNAALNEAARLLEERDMARAEVARLQTRADEYGFIDVMRNEMDALREQVSAVELARWNWEQSAVSRAAELERIRAVLADTEENVDAVADEMCPCTERHTVGRQILAALRCRAGIES